MDKIIKILQESANFMNAEELAELKNKLVDAYWRTKYNEMEAQFILDRDKIVEEFNNLV
tara:strand:+ start:234 stop:410 length:177 start_codon:yes stop_codon:yes gene_type:complete